MRNFGLTISLLLLYLQTCIQVSALAGALAHYGVRKGDRVLIYMPLIPETIISMLATVRLGAIHSVVFGGKTINSVLLYGFLYLFTIRERMYVHGDIDSTMIERIAWLLHYSSFSMTMPVVELRNPSAAKGTLPFFYMKWMGILSWVAVDPLHSILIISKVKRISRLLHCHNCLWQYQLPRDLLGKGTWIKIICRSPSFSL